MSENYQQVIITSQPIALCKLLKIANLVAGGGEAKIVITQGYVALNGEVELQKRKKVVAGDIIEFNGELVQVQFQAKEQQPKEHQTKESNNRLNKKVNKGTPAKQKTKDIDVPSPASSPEKVKRKPISF
jgi:ribosome-associated protein